jgi:hypothetical protein
VRLQRVNGLWVCSARRVHTSGRSLENIINKFPKRTHLALTKSPGYCCC